MAGANITLKPDRLLLNPKFDGYKLSLDSIPTYKMSLSEEIDLVDVDRNDYNFQHIRWFALYNHLVPDQWNRDHVYYVDKSWNVNRVRIQDDGKLDEIRTVFKIPDHAEFRSKSRFNITLKLIHEDYAALADGAGTLFLIRTGDRRSGESQWNVEFSHCASSNGSLCSLIDASYHSDNNGLNVYNCLLLETSAVTPTKEKPPVFLQWLTLQRTEGKEIEITRNRRLEGAVPPEYACFDKSAEGLSIAAVKPFRFLSDSAKPVDDTPEPEPNPDSNADLPAYSWVQTSEDVTVVFKIDGSFDKTDIDFDLTGSTLKVGLKSGAVFLEGELGGAVDRQGSTWLIDENKLEIILTKTSSGGRWDALIVGDERGEQVMDHDYIADVHERLQHLTSDVTETPTQQSETEPFNAQQLEDCDIYPDASSTLSRLDGETHRSSHIASLASHQLLFTAALEPAEPPALCLRFDVDGLVWQPTLTGTDDRGPWTHVGTFNAFAYVHAGKENKKFTSCSPDLSFVAVSDCTRHVYVYRQQDGVSLMNRKSRESVQIAKQHVWTIDSLDNILGMCCSDHWLFVLTKNELFAARIVV